MIFTKENNLYSKYGYTVSIEEHVIHETPPKRDNNNVFGMGFLCYQNCGQPCISSFVDLLQ